MGLFWENRKIKEQKEEQMLAAILKKFESEVSSSPVVKPDPSQKLLTSLNKTGSVEDLARFLSSKGLFNYSDWEDFQSKKNG